MEPRQRVCQTGNKPVKWTVVGWPAGRWGRGVAPRSGMGGGARGQPTDGEIDGGDLAETTGFGGADAADGDRMLVLEGGADGGERGVVDFDLLEGPPDATAV